MQTILFHPDREICDALERMTKHLDDVTVLCTSYEELHESGIASALAMGLVSWTAGLMLFCVKSTAQSWNTASSGESFRSMGLSFRLALLSWRKA